MQRAHALAILAVAMLAVPAGFAAVSAGDHFLNLSSAPTATPPAGNVAKSWEGTVDSAVDQGTLDLRTFAGHVHVVGVEGDAWSVQVMLPPKDPSAIAVPSDPSLTYDFKGEVQDGVLGIALHVTRDSAAAVSVNDEQVPDILAQVPARLMWNTVYICSAADMAPGQLDGLFGDPSTQQSKCVQDSSQSLGIDLQASPDAKSTVRAPFLVEGLHGGQLAMYASNDNLATKGLVFDNASLITNNGQLRVAGDFAQLQGVSNNGDILAELTNAASAAAHFITNNGDVKVTVSVAKDRGYQVRAMTNNGDIKVDLPDMTPTADDGPQAGSSDGFGLPLLAGQPPKGPEHPDTPNHSVETQTVGYDGLRVRTMLDIVTNNGDIYVGPIKASSK